jgi:hypothetical protein
MKCGGFRASALRFRPCTARVLRACVRLTQTPLTVEPSP